MVRVETDEKTQPQDPTMYGQVCGSVCLMQRKAKRSKNGLSRNQSSITRQLRGVFFIEPNDEEFKLTMKAARRKLGVPMPAAMPCKIPTKRSGEIHRSIGKRKMKYACVTDADESTRPRLEGPGHQPHQDHITAKGTNSITHCTQSCSQIHFDASSNENSECTAAVVKEWAKLLKNSGMAADESQKQETSDR